MLETNDLSKIKYRCDVRLPNEESKLKLLFHIHEIGAVRVTANKLNSETGEPYSSKQQFYASSQPDIERMLDSLMREYKIPGTSHSPSKFDWTDYCDVIVEKYPEGG